MSSDQRISRRTVLRGVGTALSLPLLDAMIPTPSLAAGAKPPAKPPVRMAFVFFPIGAYMPDWTPEKLGPDYALTPTLTELASIKKETLVLSGLAHDNARAKGDGAGDHARCSAAFLTGAHPRKTSGKDIHLGVSVDQLAAQKIGARTRFPSIELGCDPNRNVGNCDSGYSCAYSSNIAWRSPTTPVPKEVKPRAAFDRLFGSGNKDEIDKGTAKRDLYDQSILDLVSEDARRLQRRLGRTDKRKLEEYFSSVREIERRIAGAESVDIAGIQGTRPPGGIPRDFQEHARLMCDVLTLAFQTDMSRIGTFMLARAGNNRSYPQIGVRSGHHSQSHHRNETNKVADIQKIDRYHLAQFVYLVEKFKSVREGDGTLLDNSMLLYGSGIADGNRHSHHDLPTLLAGRGGGKIDTGRHVRYQRNTPLANLFLNMLDLAGASADSIGDSTGRLKQLTV